MRRAASGSRLSFPTHMHAAAKSARRERMRAIRKISKAHVSGRSVNLGKCRIARPPPPPLRRPARATHLHVSGSRLAQASYAHADLRPRATPCIPAATGARGDEASESSGITRMVCPGDGAMRAARVSAPLCRSPVTGLGSRDGSSVPHMPHLRLAAPPPPLRAGGFEKEQAGQTRGSSPGREATGGRRIASAAAAIALACGLSLPHTTQTGSNAEPCWLVHTLQRHCGCGLLYRALPLRRGSMESRSAGVHLARGVGRTCAEGGGECRGG
jgi:hypothetical protein